MMSAKQFLIILVIIIISSCVVGTSDAAVPSKLNTCAAWLSTYQQFHIDDKETSILLSDYEGELKRLNLYSVDEIENSLDLPIMLSAADNSSDTRKTLTMCTEIAKNFVGIQN